jgi:signal transduction histidine kinase
MNKINIRFSTNILKRLGEELNPDLTQGLIELVKNTYDADAHNCVIELSNIFNAAYSNQISLFESKISIKDDGEGMTTEDITNSWLLLGESKKNINKKTSLGRIPVGDKGLGRLAALRLGTKITLKTVSKKNLYIRYSLEIDWLAYDNVQAVEDVLLEIKQETLLQPQNSGTEIIIEHINRSISKQEVQKFARALVLLANPFNDDELGFKPTLKIDEFKEIEQLVTQRYFKEAEFHLIATVEQGIVNVFVKDWLGNILYTATHQDINTQQISYPIPDSIFELWIFDFESGTFSTRAAIRTNVKQWLNEVGGVHLYYNQLRVLPYGDKQEQWFGSNLKRLTGNKKTSNLIGRLLVTDTEKMLQQTTDRHGFIENESFVELKQFAADIFDWLAKRWQQQQYKKVLAEKERQEQESGESKRKISEAIKTISNQKERDYVKKASDERERYYREKEAKLRKELQLYRTLSTTGITAAVFAHESNSNPLKVIHNSISTIEKRSLKLLDKKIYMEKLDAPIDRIKKSTLSLEILSNVALSLVNNEKRRNITLNVHKTIKETIVLFESFIEGRGTKIFKEFTNINACIFSNPAALESIIVNLLNNSLVSFENKEIEQRIIIIRTKIVSYNKSETNQGIEIHVLDNGTGIEGIHINDIWLAGETTTKNGTGLGLTIVRDTVQDMGGKVHAIAKNEELGGAEIIITLPILGVNNYEQ